MIERLTADLEAMALLDVEADEDALSAGLGLTALSEFMIDDDILDKKTSRK